jgi:hypothetical protein
MNDIVKKTFSTNALVLDDDMADQLLAGIEQSQATTLVAGGGKDLIKLDKSAGTWGIGQADEPMQVGSTWWINILSICHGFVCWSDYKGARKNERLGEIMCPMSQPKPPKPAEIDGFAFKEQRSFEAVCLTGEDEGREVQFKNSSTGTLKGMNKLADAIKAQLRANRAFPCPVVVFKSEKYRHGDYGWIWNPIFEPVDWATMQGELLSETGLIAPAQPAIAKVTKPPLFSQVAAKAASLKPKAPPAAEPEADDEPEQVVPVRGQRRRPAA